MIKFTIPIAPITKKNSQQIFRPNGGKIMIAPSKQYKQYEHEAGFYIPCKWSYIDRPVNVKTVFYMPTRRKVDISNLISAAHDILTHYGVLKDDNYKIIVSVDGSRVYYDSKHPRTEIEIEERV